MEIRNYSLDDLPSVAGEILKFAGNEKIFAFYGEMGAGKSTLIKKICELLGAGNIATSPTFSIVNEYVRTNETPLYHFDCYRLRDAEEALDIGCEEYFQSGNYCFIEWPELIVQFLPETFIKLDLTFTGGLRTIHIKKVTNGRK